MGLLLISYKISFAEMYVCIDPSAGDGVLWCRFSHRSAEEDQRELSKRGLDRLHMPWSAQSEYSTDHDTKLFFHTKNDHYRNQVLKSPHNNGNNTEELSFYLRHQWKQWPPYKIHSILNVSYYSFDFSFI